jgi:hypothetical protein
MTRTDEAFCFIHEPGSRHLAYSWLHRHLNYFFTGPIHSEYALSKVHHLSSVENPNFSGWFLLNSVGLDWAFTA